MTIFARKTKQPELKPCPRCREMIAPDALECPACGLDLREVYRGPSPEAETLPNSDLAV